MSTNPQVQTILAQNQTFAQAKASGKITPEQYNTAMAEQNKQLAALGYQQQEMTGPLLPGQTRPVTVVPIEQPRLTQLVGIAASPTTEKQAIAQGSPTYIPQEQKNVYYSDLTKAYDQELTAKIENNKLTNQKIASVDAAVALGLPASLGAKYDLTNVKLQEGMKVTGYTEKEKLAPLTVGQTQRLTGSSILNIITQVPELKTVSQPNDAFGISAVYYEPKTGKTTAVVGDTRGFDYEKAAGTIGAPSEKGSMLIEVKTATLLERFTGKDKSGNPLQFDPGEQNALLGTALVPEIALPIAIPALAGYGAVTVGGAEVIKRVTTGKDLTLMEGIMAFGIGESIGIAAKGSGVQSKAVDRMQKKIQESSSGFNFQDKLNMDFRVSSELGEMYKPSLTDSLKSKITGITAKAPAEGIFSLPTVETVPKEGWVQQTDFSDMKTVGYSEGKGILKNPAIKIIEKDPIDSIPNMIKGNPDKMQMGMDLFDFDAPKSGTYGLSIEPVAAITKAELVARTPVTKLPLRFGLGEGFIIDAPTEQFNVNKSATEYEKNLLRQQQGITPKEVLSFNKTPFSFGEDSTLSFKKASFPIEKLKVNPELAKRTIPESSKGMNIYGDTITQLQNAKFTVKEVTLPKVVAGIKMPSAKQVSFSGIQGNINLLKNKQIQQPEIEDIQVFSYPTRSGLPTPPTLTDYSKISVPITIREETSIFTKADERLITIPTFPISMPITSIPTIPGTIPIIKMPDPTKTDQPVIRIPTFYLPEPTKTDIPQPTKTDQPPFEIPDVQIPNPQKPFPQIPQPKYPTVNIPKMGIPAFRLGGGSGGSGSKGNMRGTWYERKHPNKTPLAMLKTFGLAGGPTKQQKAAGIKLSGINLNQKIKIPRYQMGNTLLRKGKTQTPKFNMPHMSSINLGKSLKAPKTNLTPNKLMNFGRKQTRKHPRK